MRLYLSGPITGVKDYKRKFEMAKVQLVESGYEDIVNPAELDAVLKQGTYEEYMDICMQLIDMSSCIVLIPGWEKSPGANREYGYAKGTCKEAYLLEDMVKVGKKQRI